MSDASGRISDAPRVLIKNVSGETIPGRSFVRVTGGSDSTAGIPMVHGDKPDDQDDSLYVVSGPAQIAAGEIGGGFYPSSFVWVKLTGSPSPVVEVGPVDAAWSGSTDGSGFKCARTQGDLGLVVVLGGGGGGGVIVTANIVEMSEDCSCAYCEVGGESCGAKDIPDHIWVQDGLGCFFDQPAELLIGMGLIAARMKGQNDCGDDPYEGDGECDYWIVLNMCCPEAEGE